MDFVGAPVRHLRLIEAVPDVTWITRAQEGDRAAQTWLFEAYGLHVASVLANLRVPGPDLPDLVQEVFEVAFKKLDRLESPSVLRAWLAGIAVNKAMAAARARRRKWWLRFVEPDEVPALVSHDAPAETREAVRATHAILATLDEDERVAFVLRYLEGMTLEEVAAACSVSLATVKRRVSKARATFMERAALDPRLERWMAQEAP